VAVHLGVRFDVHALRFLEDARISGATLPEGLESHPAFAAEGGLQWRPVAKMALLANGYAGSRLPSAADVTRYGAEGNTFWVPSRGLTPERSYTGEVGARYDGEIVRAEAFYAFTRIEDALTARPTIVNGEALADGVPYYRFVSAGAVGLHAAEVSARVRLPPDLFLTVGAAAAFSEDAADALPPVHGMVRLAYEPGESFFSELALTWAQPQGQLTAADRRDPRLCASPERCSGTPGYAVLHARAGYRLNRHVAVTLGVQNLGNVTYVNHGSALAEPGVSAQLGVELSL
jgi:hemoglobin/transferrin/lactoferrin receptor protein